MPSKTHSDRMAWGFRLAWLAVMLLAIALRLHQLGHDSLWYDEVVQVSAAERKTALAIIKAHLPSAAAPLDPLITNAMLSLGRNEYLLRFPAACFSVLTVALCLALGRMMFGPLEGLIAAFLLAISVFHIRYAQEVRTYALLAFLGSLSLWLLWRALRRDRSLDWLSWTATGPLGLLAHPFAAFWVLAQGLYGITTVVFSRLLAFKASIGGTQFMKLLLGATITAMGAGVQLVLAARNYSFRMRASAPSASSILDRWLSLTTDLLLDLGNGRAMLRLCLAALLGAFFIFLRERKHRSAIWLLALSCLVPWLLALAMALGRSTFWARYYLFILTPYMLLVARGVTGVMESVVIPIKNVTDKRLVVTCLSLILGIPLFAVASIRPVRAYYASAKPDWRGVGHYLAEQASPGDIVIVDAVGTGYGGQGAKRCLSYYFGAEEARVLLLLVTDVDSCEEIRDTQTRVWAAIYHPRPVPKVDSAGLQAAKFHEITLLQPEATDRLLNGALRTLQALLLMQQTPDGEFDVRLSLARVYAMEGQFSLAKKELEAAASLAPPSATAKEALQSAAQYLQAREQQQ